MITKPTLFILGAGASIPYGFPSGWELRNQICSPAEGRFHELSNAMHTNFNVHYAEFLEFTECFEQSRLASIDAFLSRRSEFAEIGKLVIASLLIPNESVAKFNNNNNDDDWYFAFWNALVSNASTLEELMKNEIQIFTFNYDRSLEKYLHSAIINTFNVSAEKGLEALSHFNIHHVYGSLGQYGLQHDYSRKIRDYTNEYNQYAIELAAASIRVIPEARAEDSIFKKAKEAFTWAENVCFLGFGFDPLNVERLGFSQLSTGSSGELSKEYTRKRVVTSARGRTKSQMEIAHSSLFDGATHKRIPEWQYGDNLKSLATLEHFAWLLT